MNTTAIATDIPESEVVESYDDFIEFWRNDLRGTVDIYEWDVDQMDFKAILEEKKAKVITREGQITIVSLREIQQDLASSGKSLYEKDMFPLSWTETQILNYLQDNHKQKWTPTWMQTGWHQKSKRSRKKFVTKPSITTEESVGTSIVDLNFSYSEENNDGLQTMSGTLEQPSEQIQ